MNCPSCKGPMSPLFTGFFCPKDCDKGSPPSAERRFPASIFQTEFSLWNGSNWRAHFVRGKTLCPKGWCGWHVPIGMPDPADRIKRLVQAWNDQGAAWPGWRQTIDDYHVLEGWIFEPI